MKAKKVLDNLLEKGYPIPYALLNCQPPGNPDPLTTLMKTASRAEKVRRFMLFCAGAAIALVTSWIFNGRDTNWVTAAATELIFLVSVILVVSSLQRLIEFLPPEVEKFWLNCGELVGLLHLLWDHHALIQRAPDELRKVALVQFKEYARAVLWMRERYGEGASEVREAETQMRRACDLFREYNLLPVAYSDSSLAYREAFEWAKTETQKDSSALTAVAENATLGRGNSCSTD